MQGIYGLILALEPGITRKTNSISGESVSLFVCNIMAEVLYGNLRKCEGYSRAGLSNLSYGWFNSVPAGSSSPELMGSLATGCWPKE
jgi:hypothetical protein